MSAEKRMPKGYIAVLLGTFITMGGTFLVFLGSQSGFFIYTFGVLLLLLYYFLSIPKRDKDVSPTKRRLHRIGFLGAVAMAVAAYFVYTFGVLLLLLYYFLSIPKRDKDISPTKRRLHRIGFLGAVAMAVAVYFVYTASNLWMLLFCIGSALHAWYIFRDGVRS